MIPSKQDRILYKEKIGGWQELCISKLLNDYIGFLCCDLPASTKFWELKKRIKKDEKRPGVMLELTKKNMVMDIICLINDDVITMVDLSDFSDELKESITFSIERMKDEI